LEKRAIVSLGSTESGGNLPLRLLVERRTRGTFRVAEFVWDAAAPAQGLPVSEGGLRPRDKDFSCRLTAVLTVSAGWAAAHNAVRSPRARGLLSAFQLIYWVCRARTHVAAMRRFFHSQRLQERTACRRRSSPHTVRQFLRKIAQHLFRVTGNRRHERKVNVGRGQSSAAVPPMARRTGNA
jgi:hypothetical protein